MESKKINQLATEMAPASTDLTIIGDPITGVSKKVTLLQIADIFSTIGTVTSVGVTETGDALTITGSPITSAGTINIGFAGAASQYVRGDGALADFPTSAGGGSSVSYYLNSSVSQGTIGGVAYRELSKEPVIGAGTDISISANGYIASYITDANDPALLEVPGGNFNCEFYFSVNSNNHNPYVYAELYKYDGTTFTLLGSSQSVPEYLTNGTTLSPYYFAIPVATSALTITDRLAIRIYANVDTKTVTLHTENSHLCQVVTTFSKGLTSLNNLTAQVQYLATGTSGTDFAISSSTATHTFNLPVASATNTGKLSSTDWATFNAKANDSLVVHLAGTETITGLKTFNTPIALDNALNLKFDASINAFGGYYSLYAIKGVSSGNSILALYDGDTNKKSSLTFDNANNFNYLFPSTSGTVALTSDLTGGTVTSVAALTLGTTGTDLSSTVANGTTTPVITLNVPTASATNRGALSSADWTTFNNKQSTLSLTTTGNSGSATLVSNTLNVPTYTLAGLGGISLTSLSATTPLSYNNTTGAFSIQVANTSQDGYLSSTDWNTFNGKQNALSNIVTGTGVSSYIPIFNGTTTVIGSNQLRFDTSNNLLIGNPTTGLANLHIYNASAAASLLLQTNSTTDYSEIAVRNNSSTATSYFRQYSTAATGSDFGISRAGLALFFSNYATNFAIGTRNGGDLILGTADTERARILASNGYFGINQSNPSYLLDVNGTGRFSGNVQLDATSPVFIANASSAGYFGGLSIRQSGTEKARFAANSTSGAYVYSPTFNGFAVLSDTINPLVIASTGAATFTAATQDAIQTVVRMSGNNASNQLKALDFKLTAGTPLWTISTAATGTDAGINIMPNGSAGLSLTYTGAATFSSSVTANEYINNYLDQGALRLYNSSTAFAGGIGTGAWVEGSATTDIAIYSANNLKLYTGSSSTPKMTITAAGNVGIGTSSPDWLLKIEKNSSTGGIGTYPALVVNNPNAAGYSAMYFYNGATNVGGLEYNNSSTNLALNAYGALLFQTGSGTERMRITSGGTVCMGRTSSPSTAYKLAVQEAVMMAISTNGNNMVNFFNQSDTYVASIVVNASTVSYGTGSDYRLKEDLKDFNGLQKVSAIKVYDFKFKEEGDRMEGVIAHELQEIVPYAVTGVKDGKNNDGTDKIQNVDYSKIVPILVKAIQEQQKQIEELKLKIK